MTTQSANTVDRGPKDKGVVDHSCQITSDYRDGTRLVRVAGRLDWVTAGGLRDLLRDHCNDLAVVIDLRATTGMDSVGVGILLAATARFKRRGQQLAVVAVDPFLVEVLCSTGLPTVVPVVRSEAEALRSLHPVSQT